MILIYATFKDRQEAKSIIKHLVKKKLIACGTFYPINSIYQWKGKIEDSKEMASMMKAQNGKFAKVVSEIKQLHSYDIPCIIQIDAKASPDFEKWVRQ